MFQAITWAGVWFIQRSAALPDTIYTKQIAVTPSVFERIVGIASGVFTILICLFAIALVPGLWNFRRRFQRINQLLERVHNDFQPIVRHATSVADNVDYITTSIRADVQKINETIATANERLRDAVHMTEHRLSDFNALLKVVQEEAEQMFVSTASAVRGVRTSASALSEPGSGTNFARREAAGDEQEQAEEELDQLELDTEGDTEEEMTDGYHSDAATTEDDVARPRLRSRRRGRERGGPGVGARPRSNG
ncbi:MAG TPA: hypothetical protein VH080_07815 [Gemmatimonadaceae bacterium]|nr:hypothetical protein [Gemmatimonadaceae bacterium]